MKNRYLSTRIMAIMMAAAMAVSAAPAAFAAERADSETIKEDNQPGNSGILLLLHPCASW